MGEQVKIIPLSRWEYELKIPYRVSTPDGEGLAVRRELAGGSRIGVMLDNNPYWYSPCYYSLKETSLIK